jgi:hypothetical protein
LKSKWEIQENGTLQSNFIVRLANLRGRSSVGRDLLGSNSKCDRAQSQANV